MLRVGLVHAKPGMVLALPVYHPTRQDTVLLKQGVGLNHRTVARLRELGLREVWVEYPGTDFVSQYFCPEVFRAHARLCRCISDAFEAVAAGAEGRIQYIDYRAAVTGLIERLVLSPKSAAFMQELVDRDRPLLRHSGQVAFLSVVMGLRLEGYLVRERSRLHASNARDVANLGVGAMLHDIGMLRLPPETVERWNRTHDTLDETWRAHVQIGYDMCRGCVEPSAAAAILHHHQRFDGCGFPERSDSSGKRSGLAGSDIHVFARIVAAADILDRLRTPATQPRRPTVRALRLMLETPVSSWIDPMIMRALLTAVPAYAPGSLVTLSSGRTGIVRDWVPHDPCRPTVELLESAEDALSPDRGFAERERFSLREHPDVHVARAEGADVSQDNFFPPNPADLDLDLASKSLYNAAAEPSPPARRAG